MIAPASGTPPGYPRKFTDYEKNVKNGELVIVDFKPFFESAQKGDLAPFRQLKAHLESMLAQRIEAGRGDKMLVFADAACTLSENGEFDECVSLESWWQNAHDEWKESHRNITIICPHPGAILDKHAKDRVGAVHSLTLHLQHYIYNQTKEALRTTTKPMRILIAEPNTDMRLLYRRYLDLLGLQVVIAESGGECLESVFNGGNEGFDLIILDSHLSDMPGLQVARKIKERLPDQKIVITTTSMVEDVKKTEIGIEEVMTKPFSFSKLLALIKPR